MAALRKAKKYNWKETNLALFGSELEKKVSDASRIILVPDCTGM